MGNDQRPTLNMSAISVAGVGGLGMLAVVVIVAAAFSAARWLLLGGLGGGAVVALMLILGRRHRQIGNPRSDLPTSLFLQASETDRAESNEEGKAATGLRRVTAPAPL